MEIVLLIVLGLAILWVAGQLVIARRRAAATIAQQTKEPTSGTPADLRDAVRGDQIAIAHAGQNFEDLEFEIERIHRYQVGDHFWREFSGRIRGRLAFLEVQDDDEIELSLAFADEEGPLSDLGLSEADLIAFDEGQAEGRTFAWQGVRFRFDGAGEVGYYKDSQGEGEGYYNWNFISEDGQRGLCIEKWVGEPFRYMPLKHPSLQDVRVYRKG